MFTKHPGTHNETWLFPFTSAKTLHIGFCSPSKNMMKTTIYKIRQLFCFLFNHFLLKDGFSSFFRGSQYFFFFPFCTDFVNVNIFKPSIDS